MIEVSGIAPENPVRKTGMFLLHHTSILVLIINVFKYMGYNYIMFYKTEMPGLEEDTTISYFINDEMAVLGIFSSIGYRREIIAYINGNASVVYENPFSNESVAENIPKNITKYTYKYFAETYPLKNKQSLNINDFYDAIDAVFGISNISPVVD